MHYLIKNVDKRKTNIGIIGLGYVGLPLALRFCEEGFNVRGFDIDYNLISNGAKLIIDTRGRFIKSNNIIKA